LNLCCLDESGTTDHSSNTRHFVLLGLAFPASCWKQVAQSLSIVKSRYGITEAEIHTGWLARQYPAQSGIPGLEILTPDQRRIQTETAWKALLFDAHISNSQKQFADDKKKYDKSKPYFHLTFKERISVLRDILDALNCMSLTIGSLGSKVCMRSTFPLCHFFMGLTRVGSNCSSRIITPQHA
jgi:hypothetical protein